MKKCFSRCSLFAAALYAVALPACSSDNYESMGTLTARIDGKPYSAVILSQTSRHDASATYMAMGGMTMISIQGHDLDDGGIMDNVVNLEVSLMGADASAAVYESKVYYWPEGMGRPFYTNEQTDHSVTLNWDSLSLGEEAMASGSFETTICQQEGIFSEPDADKCIDISGTFETELHKREL